MNKTDMLIIVIILITVLFGYRRNLFRNAVDFFTLGIGLLVSFKFYGTFANVVTKIPGIRGFFSLINKLVISKLQNFDEELKFTIEGLEKMGLSSEFNTFFRNGSFFKEKNVITFSELTTGLIVNVLAIIVLFIATVFVLRLLLGLLESRSRMPGSIAVERVGAVVFSLLKGFIYAAIIALVVANISVFFNSGVLYDMFHKSKIATYLYHSGFVGLFFH